MIFSQNNYSDVKRYFQGSYVKFPMTGDEVHYIDKVNDQCIRGRVMAKNEQGVMEEEDFVFFLHPGLPEYPDALHPEIQFILPKKSYFDYGGCACLLVRLPARQYSRGITTENTRIFRLCPDGEFEVIHVSFSVLQAYVAKPTFGAFRDPQEGSYAVSSRIAVSAAGSVYVDMVRAGSINHLTKQIQLNSELFVPEFLKLAGEYTVAGPVSTTRGRRRQINPRGYIAKKVATEFNAEMEF